MHERGLANHALTNWADIMPSILEWTGVQGPRLSAARAKLAADSGTEASLRAGTAYTFHILSTK